MADATILTTGIPLAEGPVSTRLEIRTFAQDKYQWDLYLQALIQFQQVDQKDWLSYFQIAGIHGRPYVPYNGAKGAQATGYCTHSSILFPTWHRAYLALYEQTLHTIVQDIAKQYSPAAGQATYIERAKTFRLPYWDWALVPQSYEDFFPDLIANDQVTIQFPSGPKTVANPLAAYHFHPYSNGETTFGANRMQVQYPQTLRYPTPSGSGQVSNPDAVRRTLSQTTRNHREALIDLMKDYTAYGPFSNEGWVNPGVTNSVEGIHNEIHNDVGGGGDMSWPQTAAFDPVFWLHHVNVDRQTAIWQAINPGSYLTNHEEQSTQATMTEAKGTWEGLDSDLTPFWHAEKAFWNSSMLQSTTAFGYTYPELSKAGQTPAQLESEIVALYGGSSLGAIIANAQSGRSNKGAQMAARPPPAQANGHVAAAAVSRDIGGQATLKADHPSSRSNQGLRMAAPPPPAQTNGPVAAAPVSREIGVQAPLAADHHSALANLAQGGKYLEWFANVRVRKHELNGPFSVLIFLGAFDESSPQSWQTDINHVGSVTTLGSGADTGCGKCQKDREANLTISGAVPLSIALAERVLDHQLASLSRQDVLPFLRTNLHWRVLRPDGSPVQLSNMESLKVFVTSKQMALPANAHALPRSTGDVQVHAEPTIAGDGSSRGEGTGLSDPRQVGA